MMMRLKIITPERTIYDAEIDEVTIPTKEGEITVLPEHTSLVGMLVPGELIVHQGKEQIPMAVSGGMVQIQRDEVIVLADTAERADEIIEVRAEEARARAVELMKERKFDDKEFAYLAAKIEKELARVHVARRYRARASHAGFVSEGGKIQEY